MACGLVAAPTWTGVVTKWSQNLSDFRPGAGFASAPIREYRRSAFDRPSAPIVNASCWALPNSATEKAVHRVRSITCAQPSAGAEVREVAEAKRASEPAATLASP